MEQLLQTYLDKESTEYLTEVSNRCSLLVAEALQKGDQEKAEKYKLQRHQVCETIKKREDPLFI